MLVDLNADLGEGFGVWRLGDDDALLSIVSSANIACGFHAGDPRTMRRVCTMAVKRGVAIGAQVGYRDLAGFGRRRIDVDPVELTDEVIYQIGALEAIARAAGGTVRYVKPHGALYNTAMVDDVQARAIVDAVRSVGGLPVLGLPDSVLARIAAQSGVPFVAEAFADRAYSADGRLVPRSASGAVITDPDDVVARSVRLVRDGQVEAVDGATILVAARSLCLHGDTPGAARLAARVRDALTAAGIEIRAFG